MKIAFVGLKGSGKSTFARMLSDNVYSFASPLKEATKALFDIEDVYSPEGKKEVIEIPEVILNGRIIEGCIKFFGLSDRQFLDDEYMEVYDARTFDLLDEFRLKVLPIFEGKAMTVREILQKMGTEAGRDTFGEDLWVNNMLSRIEGKSEVVVDDCRFLNEAKALKDEGFTIIGIKRPGLEVDNHPSETQMLEHWDTMVDLTVTNDGTTQETFLNIQQSLEK